ncbi:OmpH family outer membrane protein [Haloflavibacter putidus]|uniref:OmpH family outer membrane protein n=1 Tax=Haloflavibacter putidus TaxID=2576776 RepID=A0A508A1C0_9FLAO|nr:OmpH family outer membrane protein [Haloflavibacter putidus]TQD40735.1 OmpH family outer membrane protein [Haloflavibacter putidus]
MKKLILSIAAVALLVSCNETEKTAYVDNTELIKEYKEMKSTESRFNKKMEKLKTELDSVAKVFQLEVQEYQQQAESMSMQDRQKREQELMQKQQVLQQQQQRQSNRLRQESDAVIDSLIDTVKDFVVDYGKEHNYTYIFGSNETANIMYAKEGKDITDDVLKALNKEDNKTDKAEDVKE